MEPFSFTEQRLVHHLLETSASRYADKTALVCGRERITYGRLDRQAGRVARWLLDQGLEPGDRVVLLSENSPAYVMGYFGALKAGGVVVPVNTENKGHDLRRLMARVEPAAVISSSRYRATAEEVAAALGRPAVIGSFGPSAAVKTTEVEHHDLEAIVSCDDPPAPACDIDPQSLASIIFTSGSTGEPKGVMLSHRNILANVHAICRCQSLTPKDIHLVVLPFFYVMGQSLLNTHFAVGGTVIVNNQFAYPAAVVRQMAAEKVTGFSGVPSTFAYLLHRSPLQKSAAALEALRFCAQAGGHMATDLKRRLRAALPPHTAVYIMYGATEASARISVLDPDRFEEKMGSVGRPIPGVTVRVLGRDGREVPAGETGEVVVDGANIMRGYWRDPEATAAVLDLNGYHTGDLGYRDSEGFLHITGRKDGLLKVSGHRVNPLEIEEVLMASGMLVEGAVVGRRDALRGVRLAAVVSPSNADGFELDALIRFCSERLPGYKIPSEFKLASSLPKNASGKIDKTRCEALLGAQAPFPEN
jgi:acyl-CoA synthetase (AMP-forming)/AMP-acid ligase II